MAANTEKEGTLESNARWRAALLEFPVEEERVDLPSLLSRKGAFFKFAHSLDSYAFYFWVCLQLSEGFSSFHSFFFIARLICISHLFCLIHDGN